MSEVKPGWTTFNDVHDACIPKNRPRIPAMKYRGPDHLRGYYLSKD